VGWFGIVVPAKTPAPTLSDLRDWFAAALQNPEVKQRLLRLGFYPVDKCGTTFAAHLRKQFDEYGRVIKAANIKDE
jgi:tripartite-type tricarboxylate transporter receptor subunit TctC